MARIKDTMFNITYADGDILRGDDLNKIIKVFKLAINTNKKDINKLLTGSDYFYIAEKLTGLTSLIAEQVPDDGARGYVFSDDDEGSLNVYTYDETTGEWVFLANRSFYDEIEALQIEQGEIRETQATNRVDIDNNTDEIDTAKGRLTVNENDIASVEDRLDIVEPIVTNNTNRVTAVEIKASNNETNIATNRADIDSNDIDIASNKARLTATELATTTNATNIARNVSNINLKEDKANKGVANGYAPLNESGVIDSAFVPNAYNDYIEVATYADLPTVGLAGNLYIVKADETSGGDLSTYFWATDVYVPIHDTQSSTDIKVKYESNADTNAFTDSEKAKLLSLLTGSDYYSSSEVESRLNDLLTLGILQDTQILAENGNDYISRLETIPISYLSPYNWIYFKMTLSDDNTDHFGLFKQSEATTGALLRVNLANKRYGVLTNVDGVNAEFKVTDDANAEKVVNATCKFWGLKTEGITTDLITINNDNKVTAENIVYNGDFKEIGDWEGYNANVSVANNVLTVTYNTCANGGIINNSVTNVSGVDYFIYLEAKVFSSTTIFTAFYNGATTNVGKAVTDIDTWTSVYGIVTAIEANFSNSLLVATSHLDVGLTTQYRNVMAIPMTGDIADFTEEQMLALVRNRWFEGTKVLNVDTLQAKLDTVDSNIATNSTDIIEAKGNINTHSVAIANNAISIEALNEAVYENEITLNYTGDFTVANVSEKTVPSSYLVKGISVPQILDNGNFDSLGEWHNNWKDTFSVASNVLAVNVLNTYDFVAIQHPITIGVSNKYFCCALVKTSGTGQTATITMPVSSTNSGTVALTANSFTYVYSVTNASSSSVDYEIRIIDTETGDTIQVKEAMCIPMTGALASYTEAQMLALVKNNGYIDTLASVGGTLEIDEGSNQYGEIATYDKFSSNNGSYHIDYKNNAFSENYTNSFYLDSGTYTLSVYDFIINNCAFLDGFRDWSFQLYLRKNGKDVHDTSGTVVIRASYGDLSFIDNNKIYDLEAGDYTYYFYLASGVLDCSFNIMINKGTVAMPYVPYNANYTPQTITIPELQSVGTIQDTFEATTGVLTKNVAEYTFSASESMNPVVVLGTVYRINIKSLVIGTTTDTLNVAIKDYPLLPILNYNYDYEHIYSTGGRVYIFILKTVIDSQVGSTLKAKSQAFLSGKTLMYEATSPETVQYDMQEIPLLDTGYYGSYTGVAPTSSIVIPTNLAGALQQTIEEVRLAQSGYANKTYVDTKLPKLNPIFTGILKGTEIQGVYGEGIQLNGGVNIISPDDNVNLTADSDIHMKAVRQVYIEAPVINTDAELSVGGSQIHNVAAPTNVSDATNKSYVDSKIPDAPTVDGTYTLQTVVVNGVPTYKWI